MLVAVTTEVVVVAAAAQMFVRPKSETAATLRCRSESSSTRVPPTPPVLLLPASQLLAAAYHTPSTAQCNRPLLLHSGSAVCFTSATSLQTYPEYARWVNHTKFLWQLKRGEKSKSYASRDWEQARRGGEVHSRRLHDGS